MTIHTAQQSESRIDQARKNVETKRGDADVNCLSFRVAGEELHPPPRDSSSLDGAIAPKPFIRTISGDGVSYVRTRQLLTGMTREKKVRRSGRAC